MSCRNNSATSQLVRFNSCLLLMCVYLSLIRPTYLRVLVVNTHVWAFFSALACNTKIWFYLVRERYSEATCWDFELYVHSWNFRSSFFFFFFLWILYFLSQVNIHETWTTLNSPQGMHQTLINANHFQRTFLFFVGQFNFLQPCIRSWSRNSQGLWVP